MAENPICEVWLRENGWQKKGAGLYEKTVGAVTVEIAADALSENVHAPASAEIHHVNKRRGAMLNDENHWLAVCRKNHERIENDKAWARREGFLLNF